MTDLLDIRISAGSILVIIVLAALLWFALRFAKNMLMRLIHTMKIRRGISTYFPLFESVLWLLFLLWTVQVLFQDLEGYRIALLLCFFLVVGSLFWFLGRDMIAGLVLRIQDSFDVDQEISIGEAHGTIVTVGSTVLRIQQDDGGIVTLPYSHIAREVRINRKHGPELSSSHSFPVRIGKHASVSVAGETIRRLIVNSTWCSLTKHPRVDLSSETETAFVFNVVAFSLGRESTETIRSYVEQALQESSN